MYEPIRDDDVALVKWNETSYKGTPVYIGLINDFTVAVGTQYSGIEYDVVKITFRIRNYQTPNISKGVMTIYRHGWTLCDLKDGLWLTQLELNNINTEIETILDEKKLDFVSVK